MCKAEFATDLPLGDPFEYGEAHEALQDGHHAVADGGLVRAALRSLHAETDALCPDLAAGADDLRQLFLELVELLLDVGAFRPSGGEAAKK